MAPSDVPQTELVLRKLKDLLREEKVSPELLEESGMSREEMEQFVKKFEGPPKGEVGPGREIEINSESSGPVLGPNYQGPSSLSGKTVRSRADRASGSVPQDNEQGLNEGYRSMAPLEIRLRWEAFQMSISRSATVQPAAPAEKP